MIPAPNPFKTLQIEAPATMPDCHPIEATVALDDLGRVTITTAWEPTPEEIAALVAGEKLWLTMWTTGLPPAAITVGARPPF